MSTPTIVSPWPLGTAAYTGPSAGMVPSRSQPVVGQNPIGGVHLPYAPDVPTPAEIAGIPTPPVTPPKPGDCGCEG